MRLRTLVLILVAAGCGLVAAVLVSQYVGGGNPVAAAQAEKVRILFAKADVPTFTRLDNPAQLFEHREVTKEDFRGGLENLEALKGRVLRNTIGKEKHITEGDMFGLNEQISITYKLNPGERPMPVKVSPLTGAAGFIRPGDKVDVIASGRVRGAESTFARTIVHNIEVLAIDQSLQTRDGEVARPADLVTLRCKDQDEAEQLAAFADTCTLRLVPRPPRDDEIRETKGRHGDITGRIPATARENPTPAEEKPVEAPKPAVIVKEAKPEPATPRPPSKPGVHTLDIVQGEQHKRVEFPIKDKRSDDK